jgi:hypothetical protein
MIIFLEKKQKNWAEEIESIANGKVGNIYSNRDDIYNRYECATRSKDPFDKIVITLKLLFIWLFTKP